jgi:hypothetical protein
MRRVIAALGFALVLHAPGDARAETLTPAENASLERGETVERPQALHLKGGRYVGGITYTVISASPDQLDSLFEDVSAYPHILPYTKTARLVGREGRDLLVWLREGTALVDASYTIHVHRDPGLADAQGEPRGPRIVRFWVDQTRPHGIEDASGFFRYEPIAPSASGEQRLLVTFAIWVDIGSGIVRSLFEGRIQRIVLTVPQHLRTFVAQRKMER